MSNASIRTNALETTANDPLMGKNLVIEPTLAGRECELVRRCLPQQAKKLLVVYDAMTKDALGRRVEKALQEDFDVESVGYHASVKPDEKTCEKLEQTARDVDALIAVGSGTINDLCKYVSHWQDKPYVVFPTAPSMNGYLSANASLIVHGHHQSLAAHMPVAAYVDLEVIAGAPERLLKAGLGDSFCRTTCQVDWYLSHRLMHTHYDSLPFAMLQNAENRLIAKPELVLQRDMDAIEALMECLLLSGLGMSLSGGSYPASQGEHILAHMMAMAGRSQESYHGEEIAVTTLTMAALQEEFFEQEPQLTFRPPRKEQLAHFIGEEKANQCLASYVAKGINENTIAKINDTLTNEWGEIVATMQAFSLPSEQLLELWECWSLPTTPEDIDWQIADYKKACQLGSLMRDRFTFLDMAYLSD
jgi:glycerol-1-phosphate dehydrogenase [NAD(P)+]